MKFTFISRFHASSITVLIGCDWQIVVLLQTVRLSNRCSASTAAGHRRTDEATRTTPSSSSSSRIIHSVLRPPFRLLLEILSTTITKSWADWRENRGPSRENRDRVLIDFQADGPRSSRTIAASWAATDPKWQMPLVELLWSHMSRKQHLLLHNYTIFHCILNQTEAKFSGVWRFILRNSSRQEKLRQTSRWPINSVLSAADPKIKNQHHHWTWWNNL